MLDHVQVDIFLSTFYVFYLNLNKLSKPSKEIKSSVDTEFKYTLNVVGMVNDYLVFIGSFFFLFNWLLEHSQYMLLYGIIFR